MLDENLLGKEQEEFIVPLSPDHTYYMVCGDGNRCQLNFMFTKIPDDYNKCRKTHCFSCGSVNLVNGQK